VTKNIDKLLTGEFVRSRAERRFLAMPRRRLALLGVLLGIVAAAALWGVWAGAYWLGS
jgi:hypothetical protein